MKSLAPLAAALVLFACRASEETRKAEESAEFIGELRRYEATFQPADYTPSLSDFFGEKRELAPAEDTTTVAEDTVAAPELVAGFRVQMFSSQEIDEAKTALGELQTIFPEEWFYLVYDAPVYKIRAGNFLMRFEADRFVAQLAMRGYKDAWVVPEKVFRTPPPRPTVEPIEKK